MDPSTNGSCKELEGVPSGATYCDPSTTRLDDDALGESNFADIGVAAGDGTICAVATRLGFGRSHAPGTCDRRGLDEDVRDARWSVTASTGSRKFPSKFGVPLLASAQNSLSCIINGISSSSILTDVCDRVFADVDKKKTTRLGVHVVIFLCLSPSPPRDS
jgi:hypothetical protein